MKTLKPFEIKKVLVPFDFSETSEIAVEEATALAKLLKADLFLIHVMDFNERYYFIERETQTIITSPVEFERAIEKRMDKVKESIERKSGIKTEVYTTTGTIHSEVISFSKKKKIDLIIMGTHGTSGYKEMFMGSNAQRVVTLSDIPVLTIQKKINKSEFKNILIPIDNSFHSREKVNIAMFIADLFGSKIHLIGLPSFTDKMGLNKFKLKLESVEKIIHSNNLAYKTTILQGENLPQAALKYASQNNCDLIVINTGHESRTTGIFLGAFAQQIVNHSSIPVLSLKHTQDHYTILAPGFALS